nr:SH2 domain-containing protein A-like [Ipomoea batatas]
MDMDEVGSYGLLKDLKLEFKDVEDRVQNGGITLCFWLYLNNLTAPPSTILHQEHPDIASNAPFLLLDEQNRIVLFPLIFLHQEASSPSNAISSKQIPCASNKNEFPVKKWVHIACEISQVILRLHIDGEIVGERPLTSSLDNDLHSDVSKKLSLCSIRGNDDGLQGYVHGVELFHQDSSIRTHYLKDSPLQLSIDSSSAYEIDEYSDGVWSIVGGKASCRKNFSLDVMLLDALGRPANKELEVFASLVYADSEAPVEKPPDGEAPLLTSYDGLEFDSSDKPSKMIQGRASFKLKISQLSSKSDNRLFRIKFGIQKTGRYPFLEALSIPIQCISRSRTSRPSSVTRKKSPSSIHLLNRSQSPGLDGGLPEVLHNIVHEAKQSPSSKRVKLGQEKSLSVLKDDCILKEADEESKSHMWTTNEDNNNAYKTGAVGRPESRDGAENFSSDSENSEATNSVPGNFSPHKGPISDLIVFKYCLGGLSERCLLLKEIAMTYKEEALGSFAEQVSLFSGCSHHRRQILISKRLIEDGIKCWSFISRNSHNVLWDNLVTGLQDHFMKLTFCATRSLTRQDFEILRRIAGCQEMVSQENFEKMWCWLYPVAFTLSQKQMNSLWSSLSPKWMEGFITKEEAESSLLGPGGVQAPGTFILRFPISRSWPHTDAGTLVVTYVGSDYSIHHRLLSHESVYCSKEMIGKPLQEMLLEEPELSRLGR